MIESIVVDEVIIPYWFFSYSGYMSPEYALRGVFSTKSDGFSFRMLLLKIISGKKNTGFYQVDSLNLLGYVTNKN